MNKNDNINMMKRFFTKRRVILITTILLLLLLTAFAFKKDSTQEPIVLPPGEVKLLQTTPPAGTRDMLFMGTAIIFEFDSPIDISTVVIKISPSIDFEIDPGKGNANAIAIKPLGEWDDGVKYQITINKELLSKNNKILNRDIIHSFTFNSPEDIIHYHPYEP